MHPMPCSRWLVMRAGVWVDELPALFMDATGVDLEDVFDEWLGPMSARR